jgi:hypothetical protein
MAKQAGGSWLLVILHGEEVLEKLFNGQCPGGGGFDGNEIEKQAMYNFNHTRVNA